MHSHMKHFLSTLFFCLCVVFFGNAQRATPIPNQHKKTLILGGIAHLGNGQVIENAAIAIEGAYFRFVRNQMRKRVDVNAYDTVIYLQKQHIYPGFILPNTTLGITEIDAVRATRDFRDVGNLNPNLRSIIAYNTESRITPTVRTNGVLVAQVTPRGGLISGQSSVVKLDAWNWEDAAIKMDDGIHVNWPKEIKFKKQKSTSPEINTSLLKLEQFFLAGKAYLNDSSAKEINLKFEALKGVFNGSKRVYIHANRANEILQAIQFRKKIGLKHLVIVGGYDAWKVAEALTDHNIPVIYKRPHSLPLREDEAVDLPYRIPALMRDRNILFCLDQSGDMEAMNGRNLPFQAGTARAYGLTEEEAIQSISANAAKIIGLDQEIGTIESGKKATFFVSTGDALDMKSNNLLIAFVDGSLIHLNNPQKTLYEKYKAKYKTVK